MFLSPDGTSLVPVRNGQALLNLGLKTGDEVYYVENYSNTVRKGWVAGHNAASPNSKAVAHNIESDKFRLHGSFITHVLPVNPVKPTKPQSKKKDKLVMEALAAARNRGYCNETKNVIRDMGLQIPTTTATKKIVVEVTGEGIDVENASLADLGIHVTSNVDGVSAKVVEKD